MCLAASISTTLDCMPHPPQQQPTALGDQKAQWCVLTTKVMQRLVVDGSAPHPDFNPTGVQFLEQCFQTFHKLQELYLYVAALPGDPLSYTVCFLAAAMFTPYLHSFSRHLLHACIPSHGTYSYCYVHFTFGHVMALLLIFRLCSGQGSHP